MYLTTPNRMYIVRADFPASESLGVWEARVTGPQDQDCSLIVHLAGGRYQAMTKGDMTCYTAEGHVEMIQHNNIVILLSTNISYFIETIYA